MKSQIKYLVALSVALGTSGSAFGAFVDFNVGDGDWDVSTNWNAGAGPLPGSSDSIRITEGYTATIKTGVDGTSAKVTLGGFSFAGTLIVDAGGTLSLGSVDSVVASSRKNGTLDVSGTVSGTGDLLIGAGSTSTGTVLVKSGSLSMASISLGNGSSAGTYSVTQTGGAVSLTGDLVIADGDDSASSGTYTISGGSLSAVRLDTGGNGTSTAKFSVVGSAATNISFSSVSSLGGQTELEFILGGAGVTSLDMTGGGYTVASTAFLTVDASAFDINTIGGGILLIGTTGISDAFEVANVTLTGGYELDYRADGLFLIIPDTLWDDSFSGTTLNNSWLPQLGGGSSVTQDDALVILPAAGGFGRGFLVTNNVQAGADPAVQAQFNGKPAYNFFEHDLQLTYDALSIPSDVTAGNLIFYSGVSGNPITNSAGPRNGQPGAFVRVMQSATSLQLGVLEGAMPGGPGRTAYGTKTLTALPASIVFNLNAIRWSVEITGTTFTDGSTTTSGTWANISAATFLTDASLVVGTYEEGAVTWASGASDTPMTLGRFQATAIPDTPPTPNPAGFDGAPVALDTTSVGMIATVGSDSSGVVEYQFTETSGNTGGTSSSWQLSPFYVDSGLTAGLQYSYSVTMRDGVGNVGTASAVASVTLPVSEPAAATAAQSGGWSDPATWGGSLPAVESDVTIPEGLTVTLVGDQECGSVMVVGKLTADPAADCSLHCDWVMVMGAGSAFEVGTNAVRYPHQFTLTLKGLASEGLTVGSHDVGSKFLVAMNGGTVDIHGPQRVSWTKLSATSVAGSTTLTLDDAVDWVAGEMLVVTSSDTNWNHAEERTIASVSGDGLTVTLTAPLAYTHTGVTETHTRPTDGKSWSIELKAEVGLLSRSVTIQGDIYSEYEGIGGHTMAMLHAGDVMAGALYVEGAELYRMGQKSMMGRYPIHWHLMTDQAQGQYVRNSSIHHSFNRAVTIHGTDYITVEDNFCYDHIGHGIFLENGAERFNTIRGNVVLLTRRPAPGEELTPSDNSHDEFQNRTPASYWITNPNNTIEDNIAAGTQGTGYWFIFPTTPLEPAASLPYYDGAEPSKQPLGKFDRNTAHSCMNGLDINDQLKSDHSILTNGAWDNDGPFYFNDCAWFSNDTALYAGIGGRKQNVVYYNHTLADNIDSIILATYHTVEESMLIADSGHGNLLGAAPTMYWIYDGAGQMVDNHMIGWDADHANLFEQPGGSIKHPNHRFSGFTWDHAGPPRNVHTAWDYTELPPAGALAATGHNDSHPFVWGQVVYDIDGSVAGLPGSALITNHPFMVTGSETMPDNWARNLISPNRFAHLRCTYSESPPNVSVLRTKIATKTEGFAYDYSYITPKQHHQLPLIVNDGFLYTYSYESLPSSRKINLNFDDTEVGDSVLLRFKDFGQLSGLSVTGTAHGSLASLEAASSTGYYVEPSGDLYLQPVSTQLYDNLLTITWSGSLSLPMLDADLDGVDDMAELYDGTDPFGFAESTNDHSEFTQAADFNGWSANADVSGLEVSGGALRGSIIAADPQLSKTDFNFIGNSALQIRVRYKHDSNGTVDFFWGTSVANSFSATRQLSATYSGAGDWQELVFDFGREPEWLDQVITRLRIDPNGSAGDFEIDYIRGSGPGETDYAVWAAGWYGGYLSDPWSDWDGNGLSNHAERLWGMDPFTSDRSSAITQSLDVVNGVFTYTRRDVGLSGAVYSIWVSTDLVEWTEDTAAIQSRLSLNNEIETMEVSLDSNWLNNNELFIQVRAVE